MSSDSDSDMDSLIIDLMLDETEDQMILQMLKVEEMILQSEASSSSKGKRRRYVGRDREGARARRVGGVHTSSSDNEDNVKERSRPTGEKVVKRKSKEMKEATDKLKELMETYKTKNEDKLKKLGEFNRKAEDKILMKDTTKMNPDQLRIHEHFCQNVKKKRGIE
ncbi:hypothetical protein C2S52_006662 [Perilla frutescens var. hirtella]|nr:hypothetical protein C2S52_006662 [Perilla frutescens var. hirtella]